MTDLAFGVFDWSGRAPEPLHQLDEERLQLSRLFAWLGQHAAGAEAAFGADVRRRGNAAFIRSGP